MRRKCRMVSILLAGIEPSRPRSKDQALASVTDPHRCPKWPRPGGRLQSGTVAGFTSERWPASTRNGGRLRVGIHGRLQSEFADGEKPICDMTMTKLLRDDGIKGVTVHGFRSAFTDWSSEKTRFPKEVADKALA